MTRTTFDRLGLPAVGLAAVALAAACSPPASHETILFQAPLDSLDEVLTRSDVSLDSDVTADGGGAIRVTASGPRTVRIAELDPPQVERARLLYRAKLRTEGLQGQAYLEMWCVFPGRGEYFSRALHAPLSGTTEWTLQETPFLLQEGQVPSRVKLNLVVAGTGTVWVDQITLARAPL